MSFEVSSELSLLFTPNLPPISNNYYLWKGINLSNYAFLQNEINTIPFFDIQLPKEIAVVIFGFLDMGDLCNCAMVR